MSEILLRILYYYHNGFSIHIVPRPNIFMYISPIHVNFHQEQCLWLAEFVQGVAQTVNIDLLLSAHDEGQHLLQELKAKRDVVNKLNGVDIKIYLPYSKVRETAAIDIIIIIISF